MTADSFGVRDDDARRLFEWIADRFKRSGNLIARRPGERHGTIEYAALRLPSGEVGIMILSETEVSDSSQYSGLVVAWMRKVVWSEGYYWSGLRPNEALLSLSQYSTFDEALATVFER